MSPKKILVTSALPYANGPLHFGHIAGAYLPADCYVRFQRLMGEDVLYICGSDEYGIAITLSAELAGKSPKEHVDMFHRVNSDFFEKLQISFDHYSRTTWEGHVEPTQQFFNELLQNGFIEARITEQLYSEKENKFLADRYVSGTCPRCGFEGARGDECPRCGASYDATELKNPRSKLTGSALILKPTKHWFLLLDLFKERLKAWLSTKNWKVNVVNFIQDYIEHLHARSITRDMTWGVPVPLAEAENKVLYVWFDAPIGYISATKQWAQKIKQPEKWKDYWLDPKTQLVQFIGKDNIPFHASIFPAMVMGQNQPYKLVDELPANEFYNLEGRKFSKSDGWFIDLEDFFLRYSSDQIRYAIASNAPETADSEFTWKDFQMRCNSDLLGKYGNLVNRVLVFIRSQLGGKAPFFSHLETIDKEFLEKIRSIADQAAESYSHFKLRKASHHIMELAQLGNVYFDSKKPWLDAKQTDRQEHLKTTLACCLECLKVLALISYPIIPTAAEKVWSMLGFKDSIEKRGWQQALAEKIPQEQMIPQPTILFQRIEDEQIEAEIQKLKNFSTSLKKIIQEPVQIAPKKPPVSIEDVRKLDLRVGVIRQAEKMPKSNKMLKLQVDIGSEMKTIMSGIGESYDPQNLIGKQIVVVANLQPASLMGVQSEGMLLAAKNGKELEVIQIENCPPGSEVS